jgi:predicted peroxiredoxin
MNENITTAKAAITLSTGLEDPEKVTVAFLTALGAAETGRPTMIFLAKEAVRLVVGDVAQGTACEGCPPLGSLVERYQAAGGEFLVCPLCFNAKGIDEAQLHKNATLGGTVPFWEWIGEGATSFSF